MPPLISRPQLVLLALIIVVAIIYFRGMDGPFIFDDGPAITGNGYLKIDGHEFDEWRTASLSSNSGPTHRPIAVITLAANIVATDGVDAFALKSTNLLIHLACGVLVFLFARIVLRRGLTRADRELIEWTAVLAAALWLLAPLHVSTVLYTVQRMAQLATLFALAGLVLFAYRREQWRRRGAGTGELVATSLWLLLLLGLATYSKENGALMVWLLPVVEVTLFRGQWAGRDSAVLRWLGWAALLAPLLLLLVVLGLSPDTLLEGYSRRDFNVQERLLTQLRLLWQYLGWMLFPDINTMGFQHDDIALSTGWFQPVSTMLAALGWLLALAAGFWLRRRYPLLLFALLFYLVGHAMESSVWPLEMVYEHRNYLPGVGVFVLLAALLAALSRRVRLVRPRVSGFALIAVLATLLFLRVFSWSDALRLSAVNIANHPDSSRSHYFLAESWLGAYRDGRQNGATEKALGNYLLLARNQFELMHQRNPRDMAALVMLYYMDQYHYPQLQPYNDWFADLEELARDRPLQASDYSALETLVDCFKEGACEEPRERVESLLHTLEARYPGNTRLLALRYRYLKSLDTPLAERLQLLESMRAASPFDSRVYQFQLLEYADIGDLAGLYEATRAWLAHDPGRRQLTVIRRMYDSPGRGASPAGDAARPAAAASMPADAGGGDS